MASTTSVRSSSSLDKRCHRPNHPKDRFDYPAARNTADVSVRIFDPARVRFFAKAKGRRAKNDSLDAAVIAEFTASQTTVPSAPDDPVREELAGLIKARRLLVEKRDDLNKSIAHAPVAAQEVLSRAVEYLARKVDTLDAAICQAAKAQPILSQTIQAFQTAPVRRALYLAALSAATNTQGVIADFYNSLIQRKKPSKLALTACTRKRVARLNAMLAKGVTWEANPA